MPTIDISRSPKDYLPKSRSTTGGLLKSLGLLSVALLIALAAGLGAVMLLRLLGQDVPAFIGIPVGSIVLVLVLRYIARRYEWIMPWYYLLPAIIFLLTFTFFPVVLTIGLAFTDYAGIRNGELNVSSETPIVAYDGAELRIADPGVLDCADLRNGCDGVRAIVYASAEYAVAAASFEDATLVLAEAPPEGRDVTSVEMFLPELGFSFETRVLETRDGELVLERAPPFPPDLESITVRLDRQEIQTTIASEDGDQLLLAEPLPPGAEPTAIARYNDFGFIGWRHFRQILASAPRALIPVFLWNVAFAVLTVLLNTTVGVFLAVLLNNKA
ncbi:MAG: sugar ABC transporter permease, partial [Trueperaceae bacterium]